MKNFCKQLFEKIELKYYDSSIGSPDTVVQSFCRNR